MMLAAAAASIAHLTCLSNWQLGSWRMARHHRTARSLRRSIKQPFHFWTWARAHSPPAAAGRLRATFLPPLACAHVGEENPAAHAHVAASMSGAISPRIPIVEDWKRCLFV